MRPTSRSPGTLLLMALAWIPRPGEAGEIVQRPVTARVWEVRLDGERLQFDLPDRWIAAQTVLAVAESETLRASIDYELEPNEGILRLLEPRGEGTLRVEYEIVPLAIGRVFQNPIPPDTAGTGSAAIPPRPGRLREITSQSRLQLRGSKTISLEVGTAQDLTVRQSLDVALGGEIVTGVTVRGVLSDRQTPLQPEGRTTELSDLDRIFLQVDGPGASMTLGDFQLKGPAGLFTGYERQLEGILLEGRRDRARLKVAAATVPGEYLSIEFVGEEGKQGPYELRPEAASLDAVILAGSETVWLDGERLVRGEDRDYVIDYAAATIGFTGRRVIGNASRITVDLLISSQPYRRAAYAGEAGWGAAYCETCSGFGLRATVLAERDDVGRPIGGPLTDREKTILREAGDSLTVDLASGVDCGEPGHGDYQWVEADSLERPFLRYVGTAAGGSCNVRFDDVGERRGDYADSLLADGTRIYRYIGYRQGRFLPGRAVPRPMRHDLLDLLGFWSSASGLRLEVEAAGSADDPNTFSSLHDADRFGGALRLRLARDLRPLRLGGRAIGRWGITAESRDLEERFRPLGRVDPSWYGYDWGIAPTRLGGASRRRSAQVTHEPGFGLAFTGAYETLSNRRDLEGGRSRFDLRRSGRLYAHLERLRAATRDFAGGEEERGKHSIDQATCGLRTSRAEGSVRVRRERTMRGSHDTHRGSGFDEWSATTAYLPGRGAGRFEITRTDRFDRLADGVLWRDGDRVRTWQIRSVWSPAGRQLEAQYVRRDLFRDSGDDVRSDLASLLWSQTAGDGRFSSQLRAELNSTEEETRIKSIEYVGDDNGRYDSLGVYVGTGDYDLLLLPAGTSQRQRRLETSWRVDLAPGRGAAESATTLPGRLWRTSQWLLFATFSSRTSGSPSEFWSSLPEILLAEKDGVPLASHKIRAEASALPRARWASPRLKMRRQRSRENLFENVQTLRVEDLWSMSLRSLPASGWTIEQELQAEREEETTALLGSSSARGSLGWQSLLLRVGGRWQPDAAWTLRLDIHSNRRTRVPGREHYEVVQLVPGLVWVGQSRTRIDLRATRTWVERPSTRILGLETAGWEVRGNLSARLRGSLDASVIGQFEAPDGVKSRSSVRAELRALF